MNHKSAGEELCRALLEMDKPSEYFEELRLHPDFEKDFPELHSLIGLRQNPLYHAEGDVWNHTMMVTDAAVRFRGRASFAEGFMLSALCHDFGKAVCTTEENGRIRSIGHEKAGLPIAEGFLRRLCFPPECIKYVLNMCLLHMQPNTIAADRSSLRASSRMFDRAAEPEDLIYLALSDSLGQLPEKDTAGNAEFLFDRLRQYKAIMAEPYISPGELREAGVRDEFIPAAMAHAHRLRLSNQPKAAAMKQTLAFVRSEMEKT